MTRRLIAAGVLILLLLAGSGFYTFLQAAKADLQQARRAQCAVAYELVLHQLLERADVPGGQASAPLLTQLQILESQPCGEANLGAELLPRGGVQRLLPLAKSATTRQGLSAFVAALYPLLQQVGDQATAGATPQNRMARVQARYRKAMPLFSQLEQGVSPTGREALQTHIEAVRRDFGAGADTDRFEIARVAYNEALQKTAQALGRDAAALPAAIALARSRLSRLYDAAIVGQNAALQTRIETRQLDQKLAFIALAIFAVILLVAGLLMAAAIERDRRRRLQGLVQASRRTAQGELGLVVDAGGGGKVSELERAFNQMTADLSARYQKIIDELNVALDSARAAERAKSDFLHNVSHEIRTPMNAILGMSHITLQTTLDRRQKDYVGTIHREAKALIALINDILDFSEIEAGKMAAAEAEFDLGELLTELGREAAAKAGAKGLAFSLVVADEVPLALVGDAAKLRQLLTHYLRNAVKFTERGRLSLEVSLLSAGAPRVQLRFEVADTGIGITPEQHDQLFKSIRQGDGSATRKHGGVGLGLVISKQLADLMQGQVGADSTPGEGSRFWLELGFGRAGTLLAKPFTANLLQADEAAAAGDAMPGSQAGPARAFDADLLQKLQRQIEDYDTEAGDTVVELQGMQGIDEAVRTRLESQVKNFDFDAATALLPALCIQPAAEGA